MDNLFSKSVRRRKFLKQVLYRFGFLGLVSIIGFKAAKAFATQEMGVWYSGGGTPADQVFRPESNGVWSTDWTASAGNKWECVSDESDATYIYKVNTNAWCSFDATRSLPTGTILGVSLTRRHQLAAGACGTQSTLWVGSGTPTKYDGGYVTATGTYTNQSYEWTTNPATGLAWVKEDVENGGGASNPLQEFGVLASSMDASDEIRVSDIVLTVRYN